MSDYISKSAVIEEIKKQKDDNDMHCRLCMDTMIEIVEEQPTISETEILRKAFERVVERLEELKFTTISKNAYVKTHNKAIDLAISEIKEECGISE